MGFPSFVNTMRPSRKSSGFTLIELLVVIVMLAVLAAIIAIVGRNMIQKSKAMQMAGNLKQMAPLFQIYATEHFNQMLPCKSEQRQPDNTVAEMIWHEVMLSMLYENLDPAQFKTVDWWKSNKSFLQNPLFKATDSPRGWTPLNPGYGYNLKLPENYQLAASGTTPSQDDAEALAVPMAALNDPGRIPLIAPCDNYYYRYDVAQIGEFTTSSTLAKFLTEDKFPVLFMNGNVELLRPADYIARKLHEMPMDPDK